MSVFPLWYAHAVPPELGGRDNANLGGTLEKNLNRRSLCPQLQNRVVAYGKTTSSRPDQEDGNSGTKTKTVSRPGTVSRLNADTIYPCLPWPANWSLLDIIPLSAI